jgi:Cu(I)/Ag(I) efflux system membrane fusion protein
MKTNIITQGIGKQILIIIITLILGIILGKFFFGNAAVSHDGHDHETAESSEPSTYTCSMHPQIKQEGPGLCPICAMDLVPLKSMQSDDENVNPAEIQMTASAIELASIQTVIVGYGTAEKSLHLLGKVKPDERNIAELTARFGGRIEKLYVNYKGQHVRKGQILANIYSPDLVTAQKELLEALKYIETNPSLYKAARSKLKLWDLTDEQIADIEKNGEPNIYFDILSPISGTITERHVAIGDYIKEGKPMFKVIDLTKVWLMFDAYESDLPWIRDGANISFTLQSIPGKSFNGKVSYIDPFIDANTRVAQLRVEVDNPDLELKPEMFANGILEAMLDENTDILLIPKSSVLWTGKRAVVYVKIPGRDMPSFIYREIILGPEAGDSYIVSSGLFEGEEIAMNGVFKIDASAQLAGKPSMMNPEGGMMPAGHDHGMMAGEHTTLKVYGACTMCKERIETATLALDGVIAADWDVDAKLLHLDYDKEIITTMKVEEAIATVGHDTENFTANDDVYEALHACCHYDRPER